MKIRETVSQVIAANEKAFQDIPESRASKLVQLTLQEIAKLVEETQEGRVSIQGFGVFVIKNVEREKEGVKSKVKRVSFRARSTAVDEDSAGEKRAARGGRKAPDAGDDKAAEPVARKAGNAARKAAKRAGRRTDTE